MILKEKKVVNQHRPLCAPVCEFISYVHPEKPILMRRLGWEVGNDVHAEITDAFSYDNGQTWGEPQETFNFTEVDGGHLVHTEAVALLLNDRNLLVTVTNEKFEPSLEDCDLNSPGKLRIEVATPPGGENAGENPQSWGAVSDFGLNRYLCVSFSVAILDSRGRILVPIQWQREDKDGQIAAHGFGTIPGQPHILQDLWESALLIGEFADGGNSADSSAHSETTVTGPISWHISNPVPYDFLRTSRGLCEGTVTELPNGRFAMISRGSNNLWPEKPGYKWLSFSADGGETWSEAEPLAWDDDTTPESSATGSLLFRSNKNGKLYWMGNLCAEGQHADGNNPRSPLSICEVQEEPFRLKKETLFHIDGAAPHEDPLTEHSNFKAYQDRETGDMVFYLTRYRENGFENSQWMNSNQYHYRLGMDD